MKANGGMVFMEPMDVLDVGRMGIFADPAGAVFGVWQPGTHAGAGVVNEPGTLCWNELITTDVDGAEEVLRRGVRLGTPRTRAQAARARIRSGSSRTARSAG